MITHCLNYYTLIEKEERKKFGEVFFKPIVLSVIEKGKKRD